MIRKMNVCQTRVVQNKMADVTGERETVVIRVFRWYKSIKVVGKTTDVADVAWIQNVVGPQVSSHRPRTDRDRQERYYGAIKMIEGL